MRHKPSDEKNIALGVFGLVHPNAHLQRSDPDVIHFIPDTLRPPRATRQIQNCKDDDIAGQIDLSPFPIFKPKRHHEVSSSTLSRNSRIAIPEGTGVSEFGGNQLLAVEPDEAESRVGIIPHRRKSFIKMKCVGKARFDDEIA